MKQIIFFIILFSPLWLIAQFEDNFSDGDFSNNPTWEGNTNNFIVNTDLELQLSDSDFSHEISTLTTAMDLGDNKTWEFYVRLNFSPSDNNFAKIYLLSNSNDLTSDLNGYYIRIGGNVSGSDDAIELHKQTGSSSDLLIRGQIGGAGSSPMVKIKVERSSDSEWELLVDYTGDNDFVSEGTVIDNSHTVGAYVGIFCKYTTSNKEKFFFDDFIINTDYVDQPPLLTYASAISDTEIDLFFNEPLDINSLNMATFNIDGGLSVVAVMLDASNASLVHLMLDSPMTDQQNYTVTVSNVVDLSGNTATNNQTKSFIYNAPPQEKAIVINEILFNPIDDGADFVELYNNSNKAFNLKDFCVGSFGSTSPTLVNISQDYTLQPAEYVVLTSNPDDIKNRYTVENNTALLQQELPGFNNDDDNVSFLYCKQELITIDEFDYLEKYHSNFIDDVEGVSLERINPNFDTQSADSWQSAASLAGFATPTSENSQFFENNATTESIFAISEVTFSPDGDNIKDVLFINYKTDLPGYIANIKIYDSMGRLVKDLVNSEPLGNQGSIQWIGDNDEGSIAKMGIYIIWIEIFEPNGQVDYFKESCVLAKKLE